MSETKIDNHSICEFTVKRKRRHCRLPVASGKRFCSEHIAFVQPGGSEECCDSTQQDDKRRIPCPLDPKHSCFAHKLTHHLKKCNAREREKPLFFSKDANVDAVRSDVIKTRVLRDMPDETVLAVIEKVKAVLKDHSLPVSEGILTHKSTAEELTNPELGKTLKHIHQEASILAHLDNDYELGSKEMCLVEFGAGRGKLTARLLEVFSKRNTPCQCVLIDRGHVRMKLENKFTHEADKADLIRRERIDIKDFVLSKHPLLQSDKKVLSYSKHLCGSATDLALKCLMSFASGNSATDKDDVKLNNRLCGTVVALCCHHACKWSHYVGKDFWEAAGLTADDFIVVTGLSGWATCAFKRDIELADKSTGEPGMDKQQVTSEGDYHGEKTTDEVGSHGNAKDPCPRFDKLTADEKEEIGRQCKRVIDLGRLKYLELCNWEWELVRYVPSAVSLENILLKAQPKPTLENTL